MSTATPSPNNDAPVPGALRGGALLELHTRHAAQLVTGRRGGPKPQILGLYGFCRLLYPIWSAARRNDPYADWWLIKIESRLAKSESVLERCELAVHLSQFPKARLELVTPESRQPVVVNLDLGNALAYRAAGLLARFDTVIAMLLAANYVSIMSATAIRKYVDDATRAMRAAFCSPGGYVDLGVTRSDVREETMLAQVAKEAMSRLPDDVLSGQLRPIAHPVTVIPSDGADGASNPDGPRSGEVTPDMSRTESSMDDAEASSLSVAQTARRLEAPRSPTPPCPSGVGQ